MTTLTAERSKKATQVLEGDFRGSGGSNVSCCVANIKAKSAQKDVPIRGGAIQKKEREERVRGTLSDLQKGATPAKERWAATVVFDLVKGRGTVATKTAARFALESSFSTPTVPSSAKDSIENLGRDFGFL